jgi:hypothetical protein
MKYGHTLPRLIGEPMLKWYSKYLPHSINIYIFFIIIAKVYTTYRHININIIRQKHTYVMANWGQGGWTHTYNYEDLRTHACFKNIPRLRCCFAF